MTKGLILLIFVFLFSVVSFLNLLTVPAYALLNPTYSGSRNSTNGNLTFTLSEPDGTDFSTTKIFRIPAGFDVASGSSFANGATLGTGTFTTVVGGGNVSGTLAILNDTDLQGHKAHWKFSILGGVVVIDSFLDGTVATGHSFTLISPSGFSLSNPTTVTFTLLGSVGGTALYTLPTIAGEYSFTADFISAFNESITKNFIVNFPATTPSGTNVTNNFNGGISVNFDRVLGQGGQTTITSSSTAPAAGTGQFQLGGVYYDLNTTANIRCPCTVTVPYDPAVTPTPSIYHLESGTWVNRTTSFDSVARTVTGVFPSFSFFVVGIPNFGIDWNHEIEKLLERKGNPFEIKDGDKLHVRFNLLDSQGMITTAENVMVEIWQIEDADGNLIVPTKVSTLTPELKDNHKQEYRTRLDLKDTTLALGTYEIHVTVGNTAASQTPEVTSFRLVERAGSNISISSN